jgi:hypothetical protein
MSASPSAAAWIACSSSAGPASLSRNPRAPALSAPWTYSSRSKVVITTTAIGSATSGPASCRVASMPSIRACGCRTGRRRAQPPGQGDGLAHRRRPDRPPRCPGWALEDHRQPGPDQLLVVGDEHPDRHGVAPVRGRTAATVQPRRRPQVPPSRCRRAAPRVRSSRRCRSRRACAPSHLAVVVDGQAHALSSPATRTSTRSRAGVPHALVTDSCARR